MVLKISNLRDISVRVDIGLTARLYSSLHQILIVIVIKYFADFKS